MNLKRQISRKFRGLIGDLRPGSLQIEVTNACNFRCLMCPFHGPEKASDRAVGFIEPEYYRKVVKEFRDFGGGFVIPQGAGESFLHPSFPELLEFTKKDMQLGIGFNTNGARMNCDHLKLLIDLQIDEVGFSIDALEPDTFRMITGGDLAQVEATTLALAELRKKAGVKKPLIRVLLVAQEENHAEIDGYIRRWTPVVDEVVVQTRRIRAGRILEKPRTELRRPCRHLFDTVFVQWDGEMVICCEDWESVSGVGNVFETALCDLWRSQTMTSYRKAQLNALYAPPDICLQCQAWAGGRENRSIRDGLEFVETALTRIWKRKETSP